MDRRPMVEGHRLKVSEVRYLHTVAVAVVVGDIAAVVAVGVAEPFPVETVGVRETRRASGGSHCSQIEVWQ